MFYRNSNLFIRTFILLFVIGIADFINNHFYFYWTVWWSDIPMHFLGGACVAMASVWLISCLYPDFSNTERNIILIGLMGTLIIGVLWEIFELHFGITTLSDGIHYYTDTTGDLIMDMSGGYLASLYSWKLIK